MIFNSVRKAFSVAEETMEITPEETTVKFLVLKKLHNGKLIYNEIKVDKRQFLDFALKFVEEEK